MSPTTPSVTSAELTEQVLQTLERASQPLTYFQVQRHLPRSYQDRTDEIRQSLQELATQGRIHEFAPYLSKAPRFWTRHPEQHAQVVIVEVLTEQAATQRELFLKIRRRLQGFSDERLRELLARMLLDGHVRKLPPRLGGRANLLSARAPQPRDYLEPLFRAFFDTLREVSKRLESEGVERETFLRETEAMWRAMPWDLLSEMPGPRRRAARPQAERPEQPTESNEQPVQSSTETPFEPAAAATDVNPYPREAAPQASNSPTEETPPAP
jgi:hypothetical protein